MIWLQSSSRSLKIKIGGELSEINSTKEILDLPINNFSLLIELEAEKWPLKLLPILLMSSSMITMILSPFMPTHLLKGILCLPNGNKWRLIKYLMDYSLAESNGTKTNQKKSSRINFLMHGQVDLQLTEVSSILRPWNKNYPPTMNPTILQKNICSLMSN